MKNLTDRLKEISAIWPTYHAEIKGRINAEIISTDNKILVKTSDADFIQELKKEGISGMWRKI